MTVIRMATCFSGIGAPETAMPNWQHVWCAETDRHASRVLATRFPKSVNLGDVLAADFINRALLLGIIDVLFGGPPCQAFSVAGLRKSLGDPRGNLSLRWVQIIHAIRPRCAVTENVPGWLSTPDNAFGCFLGALVGADDALRSPLERGRWPDSGMVAGPLGRAAWTVKDAQHFGLAQRRERVFVVVDFGDGPDPAAVLFERKSREGDYTPRGKTREKPPARVASAAGRGALWRAVAAAFADPRFGIPPVANTLGGASQSGGFRTTDLDNNGAFIPEVSRALRGEGHDASEDGTGRGTPLIPALAWALQERDAKGSCSDTKQGHLIPIAVAINLRGREGGAMPELDEKASLRAADGGSSRSYVAFHGTQDPDVSGDIARPLGTNGGQETALAYGWAVRRLTPNECARLQGFPDDHAAIPPPGKNRAPDGPQYKAYGNSMAVPVIRWICQRIERERIAEVVR